MEFPRAVNCPLNPVRCLANYDSGHRCIRDGTINLKKFSSAKTQEDRIMDCLCKIHKYHLERQAAVICERFQHLLDASLPRSLEIKIEKPTNPNGADFSTLNSTFKLPPQHLSNSFRTANCTQLNASSNPRGVNHSYDPQVHGKGPLRSLQSSQMDPLVEQLRSFAFTTPQLAPATLPHAPATPPFGPATLPSAARSSHPTGTHSAPVTRQSAPATHSKSSTSPYAQATSPPIALGIHRTEAEPAQGRDPNSASPLNTPRALRPTAQGTHSPATRSSSGRQPQHWPVDQRQTRAQTRAVTANSGIHSAGPLVYRAHANIARSFWFKNGKEQAAKGHWSGGAAGISEKEREMRKIGRQVEHLFELYEILAEESRLRK